MRNLGSFDYIIVGAGSAGCVLANRLSADPSVRVLLLEAGPKDVNPWIQVPIGYAKTMFNPSVNWAYQTEPEPHLGGRRIYWPRGKVLGGSSSINGLVYTRGQREDYDHWRELGNPGWGYEDVLPYFCRSEDQIRGADAWHGSGGPLAVSDLERTPLGDAFIAAAQQAGLPANPDFNGARQEGAGYYQLNTRRGIRCSAAKAFLRPIRDRNNLLVMTKVVVTRIRVEGRRATGVELMQGDEPAVAGASREVILSAGAINSPQLLELSGIGDGERLRQHGIDVVHHLPGVGENLQDHFQVRTIFRCKQPVTLNDDLMSVWRTLAVGARYALLRTGPMTYSAGSVGCFARTHPESATPDTQIHFITLSTDTPGAGLHRFSGFTSSTCQLRPESRGSVHIGSAMPADAPVIKANYLSAERDRDLVVRGLRLSRTIMSQAAMEPYVLAEEKPGSALQSDEELLDFARQTGGTIFHPVGTCRMGPASDPMAVVDSELRVHGLEQLRVVDASIMPSLISGNTNAPAIMIGEKAADLVLADWQKR